MHSGLLSQNLFRRSWLDFSNDQYLVMYLFGNKNDYSRDSFREGGLSCGHIEGIHAKN